MTLTWTAVAYQGDPGGYEIEYANDAGGPYTFAASIGNKAETTFMVTGLEASTDYYFRLRTFTETHANNQNVVTSDYTAGICADTPGTRRGHGRRRLAGSGGSQAGTNASDPKTNYPR